MWQHAFADPRAQQATELMVRLLRQKSAYEANPFGETSFLVAASVFAFFYGVVGDRNPRQAPKTGSRSEYSLPGSAYFPGDPAERAYLEAALERDFGRRSLHRGAGSRSQ